MNIFDNRVQSFHTNQRKWPHKGRLSAETLARSGFYFTPAPSRLDSVTCFLCDARLDRWRNDGDPMERHGRMAPDCPWVILSFPHLRHALPMPENTKSTRLSSARVRTFKKNTQWPPKSMARKQLPTAKKLAESGFYYAPTKEDIDRVACAYCLATVTGMDRTMDLLTQHNPSCVFSSNTNTDSSIHGPVTRQQLRASKAASPENEQEQDIATEQTLGEPSKKQASIDDSIWDIGKAYAQKDRVVLTYSKRTQRQQPQELSSILPKHLTEPIAPPRPTSPLRSPTPGLSPELELPDPPPQKRKHEIEPSSPPKKTSKRTLDKGKGRAVSQPPPQQQQNTTTPKRTPSLPSNTTTSLKRPSSSSSTTITTPLSPVPKEIQQQSSTPTHDHLLNDPDLESLAFSPIRPANSFYRPEILGQEIMQSTPNTQVSRIKQNGIITPDERMSSLQDEEEDPRKRLKPFSPPSSPTRRSMNTSYETNMSTTLTSPNRSSFYNQSLWLPEEDSEDEGDNKVEEEEQMEEGKQVDEEKQDEDEDEEDHDIIMELEDPVEPLSEEQLNMTVEEYINSLINTEIENIQTKSNELIQQIQCTVDRIQQKIIDTSSSNTSPTTTS
ncbi:hypothetical protein BDA99DRAFT_559299 [Phascolomyces articulosus]|uniref:Uncharacterized protein n=1 Tax=Phascolomyces articulosus TaxID=60185 RepID=A0AAD5K258_9FUNG|nr:hypothetical protein BDA99DRAFT_559299 [Phascolomyces articulosus]